jgi:hypothetical protein
MTIEEFLQAHVKTGELFKTGHYHEDPVHGIVRMPAQQVTCVDGYHVSIQASSTHYCEPRNNIGPYVSFELGYPNAYDDLLIDWDDGDVFGQVPLEIIVALITKHGGINHEKTANSNEQQ